MAAGNQTQDSRPRRLFNFLRYIYLQYARSAISRLPATLRRFEYHPDPTPQQPLTLSNGLLAQGQSSSAISNTGGIGYRTTERVPMRRFGRWARRRPFSQELGILDFEPYTGTKGTDLKILRSPNRAPLGTPPNQTQLDLQIPDATSFYYLQSNANSILQRVAGAPDAPSSTHRIYAARHLHLGKIARRCQLARRHISDGATARWKHSRRIWIVFI